MWGLTPEVVFGGLGIAGGLVTFAFWAGVAWQRWRGEIRRSRETDEQLQSRLRELRSTGTDPVVVQRLDSIERRIARLEDFQDALIDEAVSYGGALKFDRGGRTG